MKPDDQTYSSSFSLQLSPRQLLRPPCVAVGHVREALVRADYSPDNFGLLLLLMVIKIPLLIGLLWAARREMAGYGRRISA
ncbi:hypothetical protein QTL95_18690 [Rhizobium sp. S152]|uniref:DUF6790 family protein n=1 Tax=Rhizobium sp. S152 TaxID=3055038 RepID=UPI0025AA08F0|nr:DUF6790 family protein [Rhizobium sp. S152]MDM9627924.1 hypothetical protein [Rhizobium sp. S152]